MSVSPQSTQGCVRRSLALFSIENSLSGLTSPHREQRRASEAACDIGVLRGYALAFPFVVTAA